MSAKDPTSREARAPRPDRRRFLGTVGTGAAAASLAGCIRKPVERILPYAQRPEDVVPGKPLYFATSMAIGDSVIGMHVESHEGRPTKVEGNPRHPDSMGSAHAWAQASVLDLYDGDRSTDARADGAKRSREDVVELLEGLAERADEAEGKGLAVLLGWIASPTVRSLLAELKQTRPHARIFVHDTMRPDAVAEGLRLAGAGRVQPSLSVRNAKVVLALDADILGTDGDSVRLARELADGRRVDDAGVEDAAKASMNRLYAVEATFSVTGMMADHRLRLAASKAGDFLVAVAAKVGVPADLLPKSRLPGGDARIKAWVDAVADDLKKNAGSSVVAVGPRQPAAVQALGWLINQQLGNVGATVRFRDDSEGPKSETLADLAAAMRADEIRQLIIIGGNAAFDAPGDLGIDALLPKVPVSVHLSAHYDETSRRASWHIPRSHFLEAWGDLRSSDGIASIQQPLIAPIYDGTWSDVELLAALVGRTEKAYDVIRKRWAASLGDADADSPDFERDWRRWLHNGVVDKVALPAAFERRLTGGGIKKAWSAAPEPSAESLEIAFIPDRRVLDGRYANNGWLQELPDPMTKLTWDNAACVNASTAKALGIATGDLVRLATGPKNLEIAALVTDGIADNVVVLPLGYGRRHGGSTARRQGFDPRPLRASTSPFLTSGASLRPPPRGRPVLATPATYGLALAQDFGRLEPREGYERRPHVRETTLADFRTKPDFVQAGEVMPADKVKSQLWTEPNPTDGHQWAMTIDLNACTGCNACTIACQSENNIPVVGKGEVLNGREMAWIRVDRYFTGSDDEPEAVVQPLPCMHCETAPCENVCPVGATAHSPDGINDMAYNRCIGTRYCANNCPYKVRRFNFHNYTQRNEDVLGPLLAAQRNPDVSVRFRGVMEKCSFCVQRVNAAKIDAKRSGSGRVIDGAVRPACAQTCPTRAITFGDKNDPTSEVARLRDDVRNYALVSELNARPRVTFLGRIRNPNPALTS